MSIGTFEYLPSIAQQTPKVTRVTQLVEGWLLVLPMIFFAFTGVFSFEESGSTSGLISPARNLGFIGYIIIPGIAYLVVCSVVAINIRHVISVAIQMKMLTLLAFLTMASALWSQDPTRSLYNGVFYLIGTLFAYYLVIRFRPEEIMELVMMTGTLVCLVSIFVVLLFPQLGIEDTSLRTLGAWKGLFYQRTLAAKSLSFLLTPALVIEIPGIRLFRFTYLILLGTFIVKAQAVTAVICLCFYGLSMTGLFIVRRLERKTATLVAMIVVPIFLALLFAVPPLLPELFNFLGRDPTLTGRTAVWASLVPSVLKRPFLGYGFYSFWEGLRGESANAIIGLHWFFGYAHNGYLEIVLQLGIVGVIVFLVTLSQAVKDAWCCLWYDRSFGIEWFTGIILLTVLYNFDESTVVRPNDLLSILYIIACCGLSSRAKQMRASARPMAMSSQLRI